MNLDAIKQQIDEALFALTAGLDQPSYREVMKWLCGQIDLNLMATEWLQAKIDASLMGMDSPSVDDETADKQYAVRIASAAALDSAADESEDKP